MNAVEARRIAEAVNTNSIPKTVIEAIGDAARVGLFSVRHEICPEYRNYILAFLSGEGYSVQLESNAFLEETNVVTINW